MNDTFHCQTLQEGQEIGVDKAHFTAIEAVSRTGRKVFLSGGGCYTFEELVADGFLIRFKKADTTTLQKTDVTFFRWINPSGTVCVAALKGEKRFPPIPLGSNSVLLDRIYLPATSEIDKEEFMYRRLV